MIYHAKYLGQRLCNYSKSYCSDTETDKHITHLTDCSTWTTEVVGNKHDNWTELTVLEKELVVTYTPLEASNRRIHICSVLLVILNRPIADQSNHSHQTPPPIRCCPTVSHFKYKSFYAIIAWHLLGRFWPKITSSIKPEIGLINIYRDATDRGSPVTTTGPRQRKLHRKFGRIWTFGSWDMFTDRQTDIQTDTLIAILCSPIEGAE